MQMFIERSWAPVDLGKLLPVLRSSGLGDLGWAGWVEACCRDGERSGRWAEG